VVLKIICSARWPLGKHKNERRECQNLVDEWLKKLLDEAKELRDECLEGCDLIYDDCIEGCECRET